jgi:hypothetical protein
VSATTDPVIKALLRGAEKSVEMLMDGTIFNVAQKLVEGYVRYLDAEQVKKWLRDYGSATRNTWSVTKEYSKIFQEGEFDE